MFGALRNAAFHRAKLRPAFSPANKFSLNSMWKTRVHPHSYLRNNSSSLLGDRSKLWSIMGSNTLIYLIIGANVGVWAAWKQCEQSGSRRYTQFMLNNFTTSPSAVFNEGRIHTLLSCAYSHASGYHLLGNMVTLYFFGSTVLAVLGPAKFFMFYNASAVVSSVAQAVQPYYYSTVRKYKKSAGTLDSSWVRNWWGNSDMHTRSLGASGAVSAVVMTSIALFPKQVVYFYGFIPIPATLFGIGYIVKDMIGLSDSSSSIGHAAHLGGAACGIAYGALTVLKLRKGRYK